MSALWKGRKDVLGFEGLCLGGLLGFQIKVELLSRKFSCQVVGKRFSEAGRRS